MRVWLDQCGLEPLQNVSAICWPVQPKGILLVLEWMMEV